MLLLLQNPITWFAIIISTLFSVVDFIRHLHIHKRAIELNPWGRVRPVVCWGGIRLQLFHPGGGGVLSVITQYQFTSFTYQIIGIALLWDADRVLLITFFGATHCSRPPGIRPAEHAWYNKGENKAFNFHTHTHTHILRWWKARDGNCFCFMWRIRTCVVELCVWWSPVLTFSRLSFHVPRAMLLSDTPIQQNN